MLVGQANLGSSKGDWQLEFRTEQRPKQQSLSHHRADPRPRSLGPRRQLPGCGGRSRRLDLVVNGETSFELSTSGRFLSGEAKLAAGEPGYITPHWDPENAMQIDEGNLQVRYREKERRGRDRALDAQMGRKQGDYQRRIHGPWATTTVSRRGLQAQSQRCRARRRGVRVPPSRSTSGRRRVPSRRRAAA